MENFINELRDEFRLKLNVDYAMTRKYGELHILCAKAFAGNIKEVAEKRSIKIDSLHTY